MVLKLGDLALLDLQISRLPLLLWSGILDKDIMDWLLGLGLRLSRVFHLRLKRLGLCLGTGGGSEHDAPS